MAITRLSPENGPRSDILLVEGPDDLNVMYHLTNHHKIYGRFTLEQREGVEDILDSLATRLKVANEERLGIMIDADTDIDKRWHRIQDILHKAGYTHVPPAPDIDGTIVVRGHKPIFGVWLMPDNRLPGMLENFAAFLIPKDDILKKRADSVVDDIPKEERRFPELHLDKAKLSTWLAWQEEPGKPIGQAITKNFLMLRLLMLLQ